MLMTRPQRFLQHGPEKRLGEQKRAGEVGREHVVPVGALHAHHEAVAGDAGVVDEDLDFAEAIEDGLGAGLDGVFAGHVEGEGSRLAAGRGDLRRHFGELGFVASRERDSCSGLCQLQRTGASNALAGSGDQRDSSL